MLPIENWRLLGGKPAKNAEELVRVVEIQRVGEKRGSRFFFGGIEEEI